jgi:hypothetical protein
MKVVATLTADEFADEFPHPFLFSFGATDAKGDKDHTRLMESIRCVDELDRYSEMILDFVPLMPNPHTNREFPAKVLIGRDDSRDLVIGHDTVSKRHACLLYDPAEDHYRLIDSGSTNGTQVRGEALEAGQPVVLEDGDVVTFGERSFLYFSPRGAYQYMQQYRLFTESRKPGSG